MHRHYFSFTKNHFKTYAKNDSYAVVTGGSDGIGLEICSQLIEQGFNICIISRDEQKIKEKIAELISKHGKAVKFTYVLADFNKMHSIEDYQLVADKLKNLDIAMLFLNAGYLLHGSFKDTPKSEIQRMVDVNVLHPTYLLKCLLNQLIERNHKTAVVIVSSQLGIKPIPGTITYSSSKSFSSFLAAGLSYELAEHQIDVLGWYCGMVSTRMNGYAPVGGRVEDKTVAVKGMLNDIGRFNLTAGSVRHERTYLIFSCANSYFYWSTYKRM